MRNTYGHGVPEEHMKDDERDAGESQPDSHTSERESSAPDSAADSAGAPGKKAKRAGAKTQGRVSKAPPRSKPGKKTKKAAPAVAVAAKKVTPGPRSRRTPVDPARTLVDPVRPAVRVEAEHEDDISIPPASVSTDDLDEHDELFFAEGEAASKRAHELEHASHAVRVVAGRASSEDPLAAPVAPRVDRERRKKLTNYVKITVGVSAVLCIAALVRVGFMRDSSADAHAATASIAHVAVAPPGETHAALPSAIPAPAVAPPAPGAPVARPGALAAPPSDATPAPAAPISDKTAKQEREDARKLLERGKAKDAVAAGERAVALDPTDADAWLILGAARQDAGKHAEARAAFISCTKEAKIGPIAECRAMLSWNGPR